MLQIFREESSFQIYCGRGFYRVECEPTSASRRNNLLSAGITNLLSSDYLKFLIWKSETILRCDLRVHLNGTPGKIWLTNNKWKYHQIIKQRSLPFYSQLY